MTNVVGVRVSPWAPAMNRKLSVFRTQGASFFYSNPRTWPERGLPPFHALPFHNSPEGGKNFPLPDKSPAPESRASPFPELAAAHISQNRITRLTIRIFPPPRPQLRLCSSRYAARPAISPKRADAFRRNAIFPAPSHSFRSAACFPCLGSAVPSELPAHARTHTHDLFQTVPAPAAPPLLKPLCSPPCASLSLTLSVPLSFQSFTGRHVHASRRREQDTIMTAPSRGGLIWPYKGPVRVCPLKQACPDFCHCSQLPINGFLCSIRLC